MGLPDYLLATWHPSTGPGKLELPLVKWLRLDVRHAQESGDAGVVEFVVAGRTGLDEHRHTIAAAPVHAAQHQAMQTGAQSRRGRAWAA